MNRDHRPVPGWNRDKFIPNTEPASPGLSGSKGSDEEPSKAASPRLEVPASPYGSKSTQKRPTSALYKRPTSAGSDKKPRMETPSFSVSHALGNGQNGASGTTRLMSLSDKYAYKPRANTAAIPKLAAPSTVFARYNDILNGKTKASQHLFGSSPSPMQTKPSVALPVTSSSSTSPSQQSLDSQNLKTLAEKYPDVPEVKLKSILAKYKTLDAALEFLMESSPRKAAKREVLKPFMSIRQKFSSSNNNNRNSGTSTLPDAWNQKSDGEDDGAINVISDSKPLRRLYRPLASPVSSSVASPTSTKNTHEKSHYYNDSDSGEEYDVDEEAEFEQRVTEFLNSASAEDVSDVSATTIENAEVIVSERPFASPDDVRVVRSPEEIAAAKDPVKRRGGARKALGEKIFDACASTLRGYEAVDSLITKCNELGRQVSDDISKWGVNLQGELDITSVGQGKGDDGNVGFFSAKPKLLSPTFELKDYQQVGINWLSLLYKRGLSCILADEMGLGKTCQVISFIAHLKEIGIKGPHLIVVPASTLENWLREFQRFSPSLRIEPYYGSMKEREEIRDTIRYSGIEYDVMVTTYNLACGGKFDTSFLRKESFNVCVYDEGHMLKNSQSERYTKLMRLTAKFRLLLTGTPLQNNLQELVSLLSFLMPDMFESRKEELAVIFKHKAKASDANADGKSLLLSEQRIQKAKTMMTPFVLRRRKAQVLQHLPGKVHSLQYCVMTDSQKQIYEQEVKVAKDKEKELLEAELRKASSAPNDDEEAKKPKSKIVASSGTTNVLMQLRKAALHPLLFRTHYPDALLRVMAKEIMKAPQYSEASEEYIFEDMQVMNDFELNRLCTQFSGVLGHHILSEDLYLDSGKVIQLGKILKGIAEDDRALVFSQFTQVLDILEKVLELWGISFIRMDGQTSVDLRQDMIDKFHDETDIKVFLLSTKAGGFGINLACANVVVIFDLSFNPHDDKQAEDRAHRVGQTREVSVIRLVMKDTVEENIYALTETKLALDKSVAEVTDKSRMSTPISGDDLEQTTEPQTNEIEQSIAKQLLTL